MGGSSSPSVYQPTPQETMAQKTADQQAVQAAKLANQQKEAALLDINQGIYARSQGLRGQSGLYEWAGPTPNLAANMNASNQLYAPTPPSKPAPSPSRPAGPTLAQLQEKYNPGGAPVPGWGVRKYFDLDPKTLRDTGTQSYRPSLYRDALLWGEPKGGR